MEQITHFRTGYAGLTNRACDAWDEEGRCTAWGIKEYKLTDDIFRATASKLQLTCKIGNRRFKVCPDRPGFCRITFEKKCKLLVFCETIRHEEYIPADPVQFHLDAGTRCFSEDHYFFGVVQ